MTEDLGVRTQDIASRARTPKGQRTLRAILDATFDLVGSEGLAAASQEAIARRANVTQSAVRHYFPKKEDLLDAFFVESIERLTSLFGEEFAKVDKDPLSRLLSIASLHYERMLNVEDVAYFEIASAWARDPNYRDFRNEWYKRTARYYFELVREIHPDWEQERCHAAVFQIVTLVLGGWATMGSSRALYQRKGRNALKAMLLDGIERLIS